MLRTQYQEALHHLISAAKGGNDPVIMDNVWPFMKLIGQRWSRFAQEFEELKFINSMPTTIILIVNDSLLFTLF